MINFVHSADLHLGSPFADLDLRRAVRLRQGIEDSFNEIIDYCIDKNADLLLLSGDIFDLPKPSAHETEVFRSGMARLGKTRVFIALGNHDYGAAEAVRCENVHVFAAEPETVFIPELNVNVYGCSFGGKYCHKSMLDGIAGEEGKINLLCIHGALDGRDYNPITKKQIADGGFVYAALGHVHSFFAEEVRNCTICYSGCPAGRGFDELGKKGFVYGMLDEGRVRTRFIPCSAPEFEEISASAEDYSDEEEMLRALEGRLNTGALYRIELTGGELPLEYITERLGKRAFYVDVRRNAPSDDSLFTRLLTEELKDKPRALEIALKALCGRGGEI